MNRLKLIARASIVAAIMLADVPVNALQASKPGVKTTLNAQQPNSNEIKYKLEFAHRLASNVESIAVADLNPNKAPSLIYLASVPNSSNSAKLVIAHWNGSSFITDEATVINARPDVLEVGKFAGPTQPLIMATSDGVRYLKNGALKFKPFPQVENIVGKLEDSTGAVRLVIAAAQMKTVTVSIDLSPTDPVLANPQSMPPATAINRMDLHSSPTALQSMGLPSTLVKGGIMGLWRAAVSSKLLLYYLIASHEENTQSGATSADHWSVTFVDPTAVVPKSLYSTPVLPGVIRFVAHRSPIAPYSSGLLLLTSQSDKGIGTGLYFFKLKDN